MDGSQMIGIVTIGDLDKSIIDDQKVLIDRLEKYILEQDSQ